MPPSIDNVVAVETGDDEEEMLTEETHNGQINGGAPNPMSVDRSSSDVKMRVTLNGVSNGGTYLYRNQAPNMGKSINLFVFQSGLIVPFHPKNSMYDPCLLQSW